MERALNIRETEEALKKLPGWELNEDGKMIYREYKMKNFMAGIEFINRIAKIAQEQDHHPDIHLTAYRNLRVELSTHEEGGLSLKDFEEAASIDKLPVELKEPQMSSK